MITLHHLENSQSIRILWLLEELGAPYEMKMYDRDKTTKLAPAAYKAVSPLGTAPCITDGDVTLAETNAIADYILDRHDDGRLRPKPGTPERVPYLFWFHAAQGSLQPLLTNRFVLGAASERAPFIAKPIARAIHKGLDQAFYSPRLKALYGEIEAQLAKTLWLAGNQLTAADIVMGYSLELCAVRGGMDAKTYPRAHTFLERMKNVPSWQRALARDGKFSVLP